MTHSNNNKKEIYLAITLKVVKIINNFLVIKAYPMLEFNNKSINTTETK